MAEPLLAIEDLAVSYGKVAAVQGVSLQVDEGEVVALVGANGAGKTTLLNTVSGLLRGTRGTIAFDGRPIQRLRPHEIVRLGLVQVPEGRRVFPRFDVRDNLRIGGFVRPDFSSLGPEADAIIERVDVLKRRATSQAGALSGGEQQILAIHRALMSKPRMMLLDEPSLGLAPVLADDVLDLVGRLRDQGVTVLLVEQNALGAMEIADRAYVLSSGRVARSGRCADLVRDPTFAAEYLGGAVDAEVVHAVQPDGTQQGGNP